MRWLLLLFCFEVDGTILPAGKMVAIYRDSCTSARYSWKNPFINGQVYGCFVSRLVLNIFETCSNAQWCSSYLHFFRFLFRRSGRRLPWESEDPASEQQLRVLHHDRCYTHNGVLMAMQRPSPLTEIGCVPFPGSNKRCWVYGWIKRWARQWPTTRISADHR